ncbi:hypothetical protein, partial [Streptomyces sp. NEAU-H3]|uniref:hypothetical protein n=1 Tax=Streptomyces sp. NEAU-H3 TaxID=2720636 RepID=UPI001ADAB572
MLNNFKLELVPLRPRDVADVELHQLQVFVVQYPATLGLGLLAEIGHHGDVAPSNRLHHPPFGLAAGQVDHQARADRHRSIAIERNHPSSGRGYPAAVVPANQHRVSHGDHLAGLWNITVEPDPKHT